jgi:hypothetical protein
MFAQRAVSLAEMFQTAIGSSPIGKENKYRAELAAPDGPSTGGGKQSLQAVKLTPIETGTTLVVGHANQVEGTAELRTYEYMVRWQQQRFKGAGELALDRASYDELLARLKNFFTANGMRVTILASPSPTQDVAAPPSIPSLRSNVPVIVAGVVVGLLILASIIVFLKH